MLEIGMSNVIKNYGFKNVLSGACLEIMTYDRVAIVGRNGTGKSTILKIIAGSESANSGDVSVRRGATIGYLEQIPELSQSGADTRAVLMEPFAAVFACERRMRELEEKMAVETAAPALERLMSSYAHQQSEFEKLGGFALEELFSRVTVGVGISELLDRPFNALSGGQKTIVKLACALLVQPDILLLDEPTNHLDTRALEWFEGFLAKYKGTVVIVSHDRAFLDKVATKTVLLRGGACETYNGNYTYSIKERERQLLVEFEHFKNQQKKIAAMKAAIKRFRDWGMQGNNEDLLRKAKELEHRLERIEVLERPEMEAAKLPVQLSGGRTGNDVVTLKGVTLTAGSLTLITGADLTLRYRDKACLMGDNGVGKTTLVRAILGEIPPASGEITVALSARVGYIPQEIRFEDDLSSVLETFKREDVCAEGEARAALAKFFFVGEHVHKRVSALSGGEKVLLKLALLMRREINLLVLDEPTNHIDIETRETLEQALLAFNGTMLFVSHDRYFIGKLATRVLTIESGGLHSFSGDYETYKRQTHRT